MTRKDYDSMDDVRLANHQRGHHFFDVVTMRFFHTRVGTSLIGGRYFITSERYSSDTPRLYSIREALPDGSIETVGEFQQYSSAPAARRAAKALIS